MTAFGFRFLARQNQIMNSSGIIPPREGVESLAAARKALAGRDISSSHITDSIIKTHSAVELLFREYLGTSDFVPREIRGRAGEFHEMSFPDLVGAMEKHGRPSLGKRQTDLLDWNGVRNRYAHGERTTTTRSEAIAFLALGEELYQHYSDYTPQTTSLMNRSNNPPVEDQVRNPFLQHQQPKKAGLITRYPSTAKWRVVWLDGKYGKAAEPEGSWICPEPFREVAFVLAKDEAELHIDFADDESFFTSDNFQVKVSLTLVAKMKNDNDALVEIATRFDERLSLLRTKTGTLIRNLCKSKAAEEVSTNEAEADFSKHIVENANDLHLPFDVLSAALKLNCPDFETPIRTDFVGGHKQVYEIKGIERGNALNRIRHAEKLQQRIEALELEWKTSEQTLKTELAKAKNEAEKNKCALKFIQALEPLCEECRITAMRDFPDMAAKLTDLAETKATSDLQAYKRAIDEVLGQYKVLAEMLRMNYPPGAGPSVFNMKNG